MQHSKNLSDEELIFHLSLARITFLSVQEKKILFKKLDSPRTLALSSIKDIGALIGREIKRAQWNGEDNLRMAKAALIRCRSLGVEILLCEDEAFPPLLKEVSDCPYLLFCRGNKALLQGKCVSVVGSRRITTGGKKETIKFAYEASLAGLNVVSGLASGADRSAHQGAVEAYFDCAEKGEVPAALGRTIAVLPSSIDEIVPYGNKRLAAQILESGGLLISEYEPGMTIANWHFVARNRIIAGLSSATIVAEAPPGSGSLITADFAVEMNRELMFLAATFSQAALEVSRVVKAQLENDFSAGKISRYKLENTAAKFVEAGAPVIKDYEDYCRCLEEMPGTRSVDIKQLELFEE